MYIPASTMPVLTIIRPTCSTSTYPRFLVLVLLDALFAWLHVVKAEEVSAGEALQRLSRSPPWVWAAINPMSKPSLAIPVGDRPLAMGQRLVYQVVQGLAPGGVPWFLTEGCKAARPVRPAPFGHWVLRPRRLAPDPAPKPRWMPLPALLWTPVVTPYRR